MFPAWKKSLYEMAQTGRPVAVEDYLRVCGLDAMPPADTSYYDLKRRIAVDHWQYLYQYITNEIRIVTLTNLLGDYTADQIATYDYRAKAIHIRYTGNTVIDVWRMEINPKTRQFRRYYWYFDRSEWMRLIKKAAGSTAPVPDERIEPDPLIQYYILLLAPFYGWVSDDGTYPAQREALMNLVNQNRIDVIRLLLQAPVLESRVYAIEALLYFDRKGHPLRPEDLRLIDSLYADNPQIKVAYFIPDDHRETMSYREIFTEKYISQTVPFLYNTRRFIIPYEPVYQLPPGSKP